MSAMNGISNKDNKKELSILNKINEENINKLNERINTLELEVISIMKYRIGIDNIYMKSYFEIINN